jgi:hypothetical protein
MCGCILAENKSGIFFFIFFCMNPFLLMHVSTAPPVAAASLAPTQHKIQKQYLCLGNAEADFWGLKCNQL